MGTKSYTWDEIQKHRSTVSCWVVLYDNVYDVTSFLPSHPGGSQIILQLSGTDATEEYDPIHPPGTLEENLSPEAKLGPFDKSTIPKSELPAPQTQISPTQAQINDDDGINTLDDCLNLDDIEKLATKTISSKAWGYYFSAGDDLFSKNFNNAVYRSILLRPRIFVDCTRCSLSTTLLSTLPSSSSSSPKDSLSLSVPFYVSPAAMARLGNPAGEAGIASACARFGAMQIISNNASQTPEQIVANAQPNQVFGWQLYVQVDRAKSEGMLARIKKLPAIKFLVVTLDAPVPGKREDDERGKKIGGKLPVSSATVSATIDTDSQGIGGDGAGGVGKALFAGTAADITWRETLDWLAGLTDLPIVLKGLQTHEDAFIAARFAPRVRAIILSNHGGRAADTAPPAVHTLLEIRKYCPEVFDCLDVWVDGGIKRGTDVVKALALGAKAVGLGRAPLYGLGAGGQEGVEKVLDILSKETDTAMRLLGVERVEELGMRHINARAVERDIYDGDPGLHELGRWVKSKL